MTDLRTRPVTATRTSRTWARDASLVAGWAILLFVVALWTINGGLSASDDAFTSVGRLCGLVASALLLMQIFLMARVPWVEQAWGQDALTRLHRIVGFGSFTLMIAHIALIVTGYAAADPARVWDTIVDLTLNYPAMLMAVAGTLALIMVVVTSFRAARRRLRYESWHLIHLYAYLGAGLALPHQLWTGRDFLASPLATVFWWSLYIACAGAVLVFRIGIPLWRSLRSRIRVLDVRRETADTISVVVGGPGVEKLGAQAGQFLQWRFLDGPGWTRAHPFSLSAPPVNDTMRFTASVIGDGTARLATLRPGTRVLVEGPYGRMHSGTRTRDKILLVGAGIGITPMRALLEALPADRGDITVINRVRSIDEATLHREIEHLSYRRGANYRVLAGHRMSGRQSWLPSSDSRLDDVQALLLMCPDVAERDVFVCGPAAWADAVRSAARRAGTPAQNIHHESFHL